MSLADDFFDSKPEQKMHSVTIERDENKSFTFYFYPMNFRDLSKIQKRHPDFLLNQTSDAMVDLIILKAMTAGGDRVFDSGHKFKLMSEGLDTVSKMFGAIFETVSVEDQEKN